MEVAMIIPRDEIVRVFKNFKNYVKESFTGEGFNDWFLSTLERHVPCPEDEKGNAPQEEISLETEEDIDKNLPILVGIVLLVLKPHKDAIERKDIDVLKAVFPGLDKFENPDPVIRDQVRDKCLRYMNYLIYLVSQITSK